MNKVAFISSEIGLSELELSVIDRYSSDKVLFFCGSDAKCKIMSSYLTSFNGDANVIWIEEPDLIPLAGFVSRELSVDSEPEIDITFASAYYAASMSVVGRAIGARVLYTRADGSVIDVEQPSSDYSVLDSADMSILDAVFSGCRDSKSISDVCGINYKTLSRRLSRLTESGFIKCRAGRPNLYAMTDSQKYLFKLSRPVTKQTRLDEIYPELADPYLWTPEPSSVFLNCSLSALKSSKRRNRYRVPLRNNLFYLDPIFAIRP